MLPLHSFVKSLRSCRAYHFVFTPFQHHLLSTYILALLDSNGTDIQSIGLAVLIAKVKDIDAASASGDEDVAGLGDLGRDGLLFDDLDQRGARDALVPGVDVAAPEFVPAVYLFLGHRGKVGKEKNERWKEGEFG